MTVTEINMPGNTVDENTVWEVRERAEGAVTQPMHEAVDYLEEKQVTGAGNAWLFHYQLLGESHLLVKQKKTKALAFVVALKLTPDTIPID